MFRQLSKFFMLSVSWCCGISALVAHKYSNYSEGEIILGMYEDYMSPNMAKHISNKYGITLDYFHHDQVVKDRFRSNVYGMSVVSTSILEELIKENLVEKIDWKKMSLSDSGTSIENSNGAKNLFTDIIKKILGNNGNLLDYGIPYFMNKLSFCYSGEAISDLSGSVKWSKLMEVISKEDRFKSVKGSPRLGMIEDPRTLLSLSRFVGDKDDVNPTNSEYSDSKKIYFDYENLLNKLNSDGKKNNVFLDGVSSVLVDSLVNGDINGMIAYNSDCLYASYGGNLGINAAKTLNIATISNEIYFLDFLVFSKSLKDFQKTKIYDFYKNVLMEGYDSSDILSKEGEKYKHWIARNFDHVKYTPSVKKLNTEIESKYFSSDAHSEFRKKALKIEFKSNDGDSAKKHYESAFSSKTKSDMLIAFSDLKERL